ncbi:unnamed protein product [Symbiodinium natans]|uniref:Endonuclease/exonuclease/phosphatase domain-containing protein n=1 Tax=Symbiodinium natans TaxID=878477 RepID=A0A812N0B0_9DINO|nr:unnamed protein product [Symbiodinium natans]
MSWRWHGQTAIWLLLQVHPVAFAKRLLESDKDLGHPLVVFQLNALQDSLAMNTQTRNMVVNEQAINELLPAGKTWSMIHEALSDAQGRGSGIGKFHRTDINSFTKVNCQVVRYSFDPSMFLGLSECAMHEGDSAPFRPWCPPRDSYLNCLRNGTLPCVYGGDQGGPAVAVWELDEDTSLFPRDASIRVPTLLWMRDDSKENEANLTEFEGCKGKLVKTLWGRLREELARDIAKKVYHEILRVDLRLSWSYRAPYFLTLLTNDQTATGCGGSQSGSRFCRNMEERYYPGAMNRKPSVLLLEEFEDPMVQMAVVPSLNNSGQKVDFEEALAERGYSCIRFKDEILACWNQQDFEKPDFWAKDLGFELSQKKGEPTIVCMEGRSGAAACNVCFNELITKMQRGETLDTVRNPSLEDLSSRAAHEGALLRLKHAGSGSMVVITALHLQTPSTDGTGEMRSHELHQLRGQLEMFAGSNDYVIMGGDFNINLSPQGGEYERFIFTGRFPSRSMVLKAINRTRFQTGFTMHAYGEHDVPGVAYKLGSRRLLDVMGEEDQGGCVSSKAAGRALMIDYIFADSRLTQGVQHGGVCMQPTPPLEPRFIPDVNQEFPVEFSDHFGLTALLHIPGRPKPAGAPH